MNLKPIKAVNTTKRTLVKTKNILTGLLNSLGYFPEINNALHATTKGTVIYSIRTASSHGILSGIKS